MLAGGALLALANATKYATGIFDPVIIVLAALSVAAKRGTKPGLGRAGFVAVSSVGLLALLCYESQTGPKAGIPRCSRPWTTFQVSVLFETQITASAPEVM